MRWHYARRLKDTPEGREERDTLILRRILGLILAIASIPLQAAAPHTAQAEREIDGSRDAGTDAEDASTASSTIEFDATASAPITTVKINGKETRFVLDPLLGPYVTINPFTNKRLKVEAIWDDAMTARVDEAQIKGGLGMARLKIGSLTQKVPAVLIRRAHFPSTQREDYDVAGGFESLPGTRVVVHLNRGVRGPLRRIHFARRRTDTRAGFPIEIVESPMRLNVQFVSSTTWLERRAAQPLIDEGLVRPTGDISVLPVWYGLDMPVQRLEPVKAIHLRGIPLKDLEARTSEPLSVPSPDANVIIVQAWKDITGPPSILLGKDSLKDCARLEFDQRRRRLTLFCPE